MSNTTKSIDLNFKPASYFLSLESATLLLSSIKGVERRRAVKELIDSGRLDEVPEFLGKSALSDEEREALGAIHPAFMGGEYLPDLEEDEVEIARITIRSVMSDATSVYARREEGEIRYRVVDEYGGETLRGVGPAEMSSDTPLTLEELVDFFDDAWPLMDVLQMNYPGDLEGMLGFFAADSEFYDEIDDLYRERVIAEFKETEGSVQSAASDP